MIELIKAYFKNLFREKTWFEKYGKDKLKEWDKRHKDTLTLGTLETEYTLTKPRSATFMYAQRMKRVRIPADTVDDPNSPLKFKDFNSMTGEWEDSDTIPRPSPATKMAVEHALKKLTKKKTKVAKPLKKRGRK